MEMRRSSSIVSTPRYEEVAQQQAALATDGLSIGRPKGRNTGYLDFSANYPLIDKWTLNGHLGYTRYASDLRHANDGVTGFGVPNLCRAGGVPCNTDYINWLGFITIPFLALIAFTLITLLLSGTLWAQRRTEAQPRSVTPNRTPPQVGV